MTSSSLKTFWLRTRWGWVAFYVCLLIFSKVAESPETFTPVDNASSDPVGLLVLIDPLAESSDVMFSFAEKAIKEGKSVQVPELPNLNQASAQQTSFSTLASSLALSEKPQTLLANGHAGAVALFLAARNPEKIGRLILVDASGVQEVALLGERHLNKILYGVGSLALGLIDYGVPHFGLLPDLKLRRSQLKLFRNSDRRDLRPALTKIRQPVRLIETQLNPLTEARNREHRRLLPQSSLRSVPLDQLLKELSEVPTLHREQASSIRVEESNLAFSPESRATLSGYYLVLTFFAIALSTLVSEDLSCLLTGVMIANRNLSAQAGIGACLTGILFGDYLLYLAGKHWGRLAVKKVPLRWMITPKQLQEAEKWFTRHAHKTLLICRCVPGTRLPTYLTAGILGIPGRVYLFWLVIAALVWTPFFIWITILLSGHALSWIHQYQQAAPVLLLIGILFYVLLTQLALPSFQWRGRRKIIGKWRRFTRPEYWPSFVLYAPVLTAHLLRAWKKGNRILDVTACNPCMPLSGLVEESKTGILDQVIDRSCIPEYILLPSSLSKEEKSKAVDTFMKQYDLSFPVVVKPDRGQRGVDVTIAHSKAELTKALASSSQDWMIQRYVPGKEFGVFVILPPGEDGFLYGINGKEFPVLTGDGKHTLEELILRDDRAVCQADMFCDHLSERLDEIPNQGESIELTDVGNHSRGTAFTERSDLITPQTSAAMLSIARSLPGFTYGRMDIRVPSEQDFLAGQNIQVLEINGVTSESTNCYDSRYSYMQMVRILLKQWKWAAEIGKQQRLKGVQLASWREVVRAVDGYLQRKNGHPPEAARAHIGIGE